MWASSHRVSVLPTIRQERNSKDSFTTTMAVQGFTTSNALTVKQWSEGLEAEVLKKISYSGFIGKRSDSLCQWKDELATKPGDTVTIGLRMQLENAPKSSTETVENNEQTLTIYNMSITLDEVVDEVGSDAVRFMLLTRSPESSIEFDLDLDRLRSGPARILWPRPARWTEETRAPRRPDPHADDQGRPR